MVQKLIQWHWNKIDTSTLYFFTSALIVAIFFAFILHLLFGS